ncbi:unnamed protein product [Acanthoscelides obtectus]|uniref:Uncharacterized protein n=1 Tax=Acanthoscelides obtectus TaxID=200917 RepID=A0A9P0NZ94_ACAOB|nr:unnamed protein product [Acanthoscelides obtectus]CAK1668145.1 hypothetical protein AOBTE_LOCUS26257 [Acanthoscelides obtectus]
MGEASLGLILLVSAWTVNCQLEYTAVIQTSLKPILENELSTNTTDFLITKPVRHRRFIPFARPLETRIYFLMSVEAKNENHIIGSFAAKYEPDYTNVKLT